MKATAQAYPIQQFGSEITGGKQQTLNRSIRKNSSWWQKNTDVKKHLQINSNNLHTDEHIYQW